MQAPRSSSTALSIQDEFLRAFFDATTDFLFMKDLDGCYVTINNAAAHALGATPLEVIGKDDYALLPREVADRLTSEDREVLAAGTPLTFEDEMNLHGGKLYLHTVKSPWRNESGEIIGIAGISRDITENKRVEQRLKEIESRFHKLFASDLMGIHIPDRFGGIIEANDEFLRITGHTRADLEAGKVRWDVMTPSEYEGVDLAHIAEAAERGTCTPYEKEYIRKDGTRVPIMCGYTLLEGSEDRYIAFIQDLTALKRSEEAVLQAEKLNTAGRFAASMAHEINNPLAAVTNLIYLALQDTSLHEGARGLLESADRELSRISRIAAQTLRFHKQSTAPVAADVSEIMDSVFPLFLSRLSDDRVAIRREYSTTRKLWCFHDELRHAFANLVSNAFDAAPGGGTLRVRVKDGHCWSGDPEPGIIVVVADSGTGISEAMCQRLFEPFVSTKEQTSTGLGLWATANIVRKHHGRIAYRTSRKPDRHGTVFSLFFPLSGIHPEAAASAQVDS